MTREELRKKRLEFAEQNNYSGYDTKKYSTLPTQQNKIQPSNQNNQMSFGQKFIKLTQDITDKYDIGYNMAKNWREKRRIEAQKKLDEEGSDKLPPKPKNKQSQQSNNYGLGNIDLNNRPVVINSDGSKSTVRSMSFYDDKEKKEILVPTIINGKALPTDENGELTEEGEKLARDHYYNTGEYLGKFDTVDEANEYAEKLHLAEEARIGETPQNYQVNSNMWDRVEQQTTINMAQNEKMKEALQGKEPQQVFNFSGVAEYDAKHGGREIDQQLEYEAYKKKIDESNHTGLYKAAAKVKKKGEQLLSNVAQKPRNFYDNKNILEDIADFNTDVTSTALGAASHVVGGLTTNAINATTGTIGYIGSVGADFLGKHDFANKLKAATNGSINDTNNAAKWVYNLTDQNSYAGKTTNEAMEAVGQSLLYVYMGMAGEGAALAGNAKTAKAIKKMADVYTFASGASGAMNEAYEQDPNVSSTELLIKGVGGGAASYITENMFEWAGYGGNKLTSAVRDSFESKVNSGLAKAFVRLGFSANGEGAEEIIEELINKKIVNNLLNAMIKENKYNTDVNLEDLVESYAIAYMSVLISGTPRNNF